MVSLGLIVPFLGLLTNESYISSIPILNSFTSFMFEKYSLDIKLSVTLLFILMAIFSGSARVMILKFHSSMIIAIGSNFSLRILDYNLSQPYDYHLKTNTSEIIADIRERVDLTIFAVLLPTLVFFSNLIIATGIIVALIIINWQFALIIAAFFIPLYFIVVKYTRKTLNSNSLKIQFNQQKTIQLVQESLGSIKDIILNSNKDIYIKKYSYPDHALRAAQANNIVLSNSPRFILESAGLTLLALMAFFLMKDNSNWEMIIPSLGALALGAQRLLPILQQLYIAWASIIGFGTSSKNIIKSLDEAEINKNKIINTNNEIIPFNKSIEFKKIFFSYYGTRSKVIEGLNFKIEKGDYVAINGKTGQGKSTIVDLITGFLSPTDGEIFIDGLKLNEQNIDAWQKNIALVPQTIFLTDESIIENICLGIQPDLIDLTRVKKCIKKVELEDFIETLPEKYNTLIGERGVRLSGGQKQRIGIARALYKNASILILDEATNALDKKTEKTVLENIKKTSKDLTIIIISHRLTTLSFCNNVIKLI